MFRVSHVLLTALASMGPTASLAADADIPILDLSKPFKVGNLNNPGAVAIQKRITRDIRRYAMIENGELVMDYQRDNVGDDEVFELYSATKVVMSTIVGVALDNDKYNLSKTDSLGEIFTNETAWSMVTNETEREFKKGITVYELLTMTSGLYVDIDFNPFSPEFANPLDIDNLPNTAGANIQESLQYPKIFPEAFEQKFYFYLAFSNILSYVIKERTGMTPRELANLEIFPYLGIDNERVKWDTNEEGVESSFSNINLHIDDLLSLATGTCKKGRPAPTKLWFRKHLSMKL